MRLLPRVGYYIGGLKQIEKQNYKIIHLTHLRLLPQPTTTPQNHENRPTEKRYIEFPCFSASIPTYPKITHLRRITRNQTLFPSLNLSHSQSHLHRLQSQLVISAVISSYSSRFAPISLIPQHLSAAPYPIRRTSPSCLPFRVCYPSSVKHHSLDCYSSSTIPRLSSFICLTPLIYHSSSHTTRLSSFAAYQIRRLVYAALFGLTISLPLRRIFEPAHRTRIQSDPSSSMSIRSETRLPVVTHSHLVFISFRASVDTEVCHFTLLSRYGSPEC